MATASLLANTPRCGTIGNVRVVGAVAARGHVDGHVDVADLAASHRLLNAQAGVGDRDVHGVEVDRRHLGETARAHHAETAQAGGAPLALPLEFVILVDVVQVERAAVLQNLPVGRIGLALEAFRMELGRRAVAVVGMTAHVDVQLAALGLGADSQVLERAADDAHAVTLEVGEGDENVGRGDGLRHVGLLEQVALGQVHAVVAGADEAVGADERAAQRGRAVAVALRGKHDIQLGRPRAPRRVGRRRGVAHEGSTAQLLDPVRQRPRVHGSQVSGVVPLTAVNLDGHDVVGLHQFVESGRVENGEHLRDQARLRRLRMGVHVVDFRLCHSIPPSACEKKQTLAQNGFSLPPDCAPCQFDTAPLPPAKVKPVGTGFRPVPHFGYSQPS